MKRKSISLLPKKKIQEARNKNNKSNKKNIIVTQQKNISKEIRANISPIATHLTNNQNSSDQSKLCSYLIMNNLILRLSESQKK